MAVGDRRVCELERIGRHDGQRRRRIPGAGEDVEDDVSGGDAVGESLGAGGADGGGTVRIFVSGAG